MPIRRITDPHNPYVQQIETWISRLIADKRLTVQQKRTVLDDAKDVVAEAIAAAQG